MNHLVKKIIAVFWPSVLCMIVVAGVIVLDEYKGVHSDNNSLLDYQLSKLHRSTNKDTKVAFFGDSSCGNGVDADLFSRLSRLKSQNFCLTGSFGVASGVNLLKGSLKRFPELKTAVFITTPDMWTKGFPNEGNFSSGIKALGYVPIYKRMDFSYLPKRILNLKIFWRAMQGWGETSAVSVIENDFLKQGPKKFSNGKIPPPAIDLKHIGKVSRSRIDELRRLNDECCKLKGQVNCILMPGPGIDTIVNASQDYYSHLVEKIKAHTSCVHFINVFPAYPYSKMGDNSDHVDPAWKHESTQNYYEVLRTFL